MYRNDIQSELVIQSTNEKIQDCCNNWLQRILNRMNPTRLPELAHDYRPLGTRDNRKNQEKMERLAKKSEQANA